MKMRSNQTGSARPEWSDEEEALAQALQSGVPGEGPATLPDPDAIFLLAEILGPERPRMSLAMCILTSWHFLALAGTLPVAVWLAYRWREWSFDLSATLEASTLIAIGNTLADAGTPGWEIGILFLGAFLYLTFEYVLDISRRI